MFGFATNIIEQAEASIEGSIGWSFGGGTALCCRSNIAKAIPEADRTLGVALLDHLVLASTGWVSLRAEGFL